MRTRQMKFPEKYRSFPVQGSALERGIESRLRLDTLSIRVTWNYREKLC